MSASAPRTTVTPAAQPIRLDGRRLRSEDSRRRIVKALLQLVQEGDLEPSAEAVAERAEVGLRSVFRHFKDMEGLRQEISAEVEARLRAAIASPLAGETWRERLQSLIERRADVFEQVMPYRRAGLVQRHKSEVIQQQSDVLNTTLRAILVNVLPEGLAPDLVDALDLVMSLDSWIRLRTEQTLTVERAKAVMTLAVNALLA